jgi:general nucleoside transport system permease protein
MSVVTTAMVTSGEGLAARKAVRDSRFRGLAFAIFGLLAFYFASRSLDAAATFQFNVNQAGETATVETTIGLLWMIAGVATGLVAILQLVRGASLRWRPWLIVVVVPWLAAVLGSLLAGKSANVSGMFGGTFELATPIALGALAGILSERSGMFNIALEGKMLVGACVASIVASVTMILTGNALLATLVGISAAMGASGLLGLLLGWLGIRHKVDQIIAGTVINIGALGITNVLFLGFLSRNTEFNAPPSVQAMPIPFLSDIPVLGPILFDSRPYVYVTYILVIVLTYMLFRTRWGLRLRASGEKPAAAGTVGINVLRIRYQSLLLAGIICGLAGSYMSMATGGRFGMEITAGKGYIALAAVIFGAWHPVGALAAALVFGFAGAAQTLLAVLGVDIPPQILNSIPYIVTIVVVAGVVGRVRGPAAAGQPYEQG